MIGNAGIKAALHSLLHHSNAREDLVNVRKSPSSSSETEPLAASTDKQQGLKKAGQVTVAKIDEQLQQLNFGNGNAIDKLERPRFAADDFSPDAVSDRILGFVQQRLDKEAAQGASQEKLDDLLAQAKRGVEKGFAEARKIIADNQLFSGEIRDNFFNTVSQVQAGLEHMEPQADPVPAPEDNQLSAGEKRQTLAVYEEQSRHFTMQVKTRDGDLVNISVGANRRLSGAAFQARNAEGQIAGFDLQQAADQAFSFSVEGELDQEELSALNQLFAEVNQVADSFYGGDVETAFQDAMQIGFNGKELAGFAVKMSRSRETAVQHHYQASAVVSNKQAAVESLTDFAEQIQQAKQALFSAGDERLSANQPLFADLLKALLPDQSSAVADKAGQEPKASPELTEEKLADQNSAILSQLNKIKSEFDQFVDGLVRYNPIP